MLKRDYEYGSLVSIGKAQSLLLDLGPKLVTESSVAGGRQVAAIPVELVQDLPQL